MNSSASRSLIFVVSGPGGVGKGTIVNALVERDPNLWLSRSWTTRDRRVGESEDAYVFTDRAAFEAEIRAGGFLEWTEFLGNYYGTPCPVVLNEPNAPDIVLEIELDGARQVVDKYPGAILIFVVPPSRREQERRLRGRGDPGHKVEQRLIKAKREEAIGRKVADYLVVNDNLERTVDEMISIIRTERGRSERPPSG